MAVHTEPPTNCVPTELRMLGDVVGADVPHLFDRELGHRVALAFGNRPVSGAVVAVVLTGAPPQVGDVVVRSVAVKVAHLHALRWWANEHLHHQDVNVNEPLPRLVAETNLEVAVVGRPLHLPPRDEPTGKLL